MPEHRIGTTSTKMTEEISANLAAVRQRIATAEQAAGRRAGSVKLVAVSKTFPPEYVQAAHDSGQRVFGENRVQELSGKTPVLPKDIEWHLIGHLQANKVRGAVEHASWIHSIDTLELLRRTARIAEETGKSPQLLLEVNVSGEASKFGMTPEEARQAVAAFPCPLLRGLMTVAPADASSEELHRIFAALRTLRDDLAQASGLPLTELSMGMSGDFEMAIAEGATMVRVGSAIFGHRSYELA
ncbi:MAG: YggS family pyridoxal phosphate-dependent enzyme [Victivallales bacterium]|nr:YggS family pyridoxal phosphate-dependent enzyme [Victivallales bacterium]